MPVHASRAQALRRKAMITAPVRFEKTTTEAKAPARRPTPPPEKSDFDVHEINRNQLSFGPL